MTKPLRINRWIRAREVRLISESGEQLGIVPIEKALQVAVESNLDLVEIAPTAVPPVCKVLDYGRYRYELTKKEKKVRKSQRGGLLKEIRIRPRVADHDLETKIKIAKKLLLEGDKVRVFVVFRGREITHPELGLKALQKVTDDLRDIGTMEGTPSLNGRIMSVVFSPVSSKPTKEIKKTKETEETKIKEEV